MVEVEEDQKEHQERVLKRFLLWCLSDHLRGQSSEPVVRRSIVLDGPNPARQA